jgi:DNA-binding IscR family transcriptional regulator
MIRMSRLADYGVILMTHIANRPEVMRNGPEIAAELKLPAPTVSKVIDDSPGACGIESFCPTRRNWRIINDVVRDALANVSLADMLSPFPALFAEPKDGAGRREQEIGVG